MLTRLLLNYYKLRRTPDSQPNSLVLEDELDVLIGKRHEVGTDESHHAVQHGGLNQIHVPYPPVEPLRTEPQRAVSAECCHAAARRQTAPTPPRVGAATSPAGPGPAAARKGPEAREGSAQCSLSHQESPIPSALPTHPRGRPRSPPTPGWLPPLTDGDGRDDEGVAEEESGGLGREVAAEILQQQILLRLLPPAGTAFGRHAWVQSALPKTGHHFRCAGSYFRCVGCCFRRERRHFRWWGAVAVPAVLAEAMLSARLSAAAGSRRAARSRAWSRAWSRLRGTRRKPALPRVLGPVASEYGSRVWGRPAPAKRCSAGVR